MDYFYLRSAWPCTSLNLARSFSSPTFYLLKKNVAYATFFILVPVVGLSKPASEKQFTELFLPLLRGLLVQATKLGNLLFESHLLFTQKNVAYATFFYSGVGDVDICNFFGSHNNWYKSHSIIKIYHIYHNFYKLQ